MSQTIDLRLLELVAAKICHDLAGPVGAVANGIELLTEPGTTADPEVVEMLGSSARMASRRLQFLRAALGTANTLPAAGRLGAARELAQGLVSDGRIALDWRPAAAEIERAASRDAAKLSLCLVLAAFDALPRGGLIRVDYALNGSGLRVDIVASGSGARLPEEMAQTLEGRVAAADLAPKTVIPAVVRALIVAIGGTVEARVSAQDTVALIAEIPTER